MIFSPKIDNDKNVSWAANQHIRIISEGLQYVTLKPVVMMILLTANF